jgi:NAD(P)H-hydrate repair Nnr-like enzyme with NAD(P)H-hydrate dehydratase domain
MVRPIAVPADVDQMIEALRVSAFLIGPGASADERTKTISRAMLATARPVPLDADALAMIQPNTSSLERQSLSPACSYLMRENSAACSIRQATSSLRTRAASLRSAAAVVLRG